MFLFVSTGHIKPDVLAKKGKEFVYKLTPKGKADYERREEMVEIVCREKTRHTKESYELCISYGVANPNEVYKALAGSDKRKWTDLSVQEQKDFTDDLRAVIRFGRTLQQFSDGMQKLQIK